VVDVDPESKGAETYAQQLYASYHSAGRRNPKKLRKHHSDDLVKFVNERKAIGEAIMVLGDFNEEMGESNNGLTRLITECGLVDVVANQHLAGGFSTYDRGSRVLDYCLMDRALLSATVRSGYEPFQANIVSDHRGLFIDFKGSNLFRGGIQPLLPLPLRDISSKKLHQIPIYFKLKREYLFEAGWFENITKLRQILESGKRDDHLAEILYRQLIEASQHAGARLKPYHNAPYSPEIVRLRNIQALMRLVLKSFKSKFDLSIQVDEAKRKLGSLGFHMPDNEKDCQRMLRSYT
jgi:hypothetical protein